MILAAKISLEYSNICVKRNEMILLIEEFLNFIHIRSNFVFFEHAKMLLPYGHPMSRLKVRKSLDNICFAKVICNWKHARTLPII